jgi:D-alanine-D-alanine ligase
VVFNLVESVCESGALSVIAVQVLEIMGIPFTGNHIYSQIISANKSIAKRVLMEKDIPTPIGCFKPDTEYILKAKTEHASMALDDSCITKFSSELELKATIADKEKETGMEWIAEKYIDGREFNCAFIGDQILPPAEIRFDRDFVGHKVLTYQAKWDEESDSYQQSLRHFDIEDSVLDRLCNLTDICRRKLDLKGYARVDFRMDNYGNLYVIDINTNPCISPDSGFTAMVEKAGMTHEEMFEIIIKDAFNN